MASGPITSWQIVREMWKQWQILFSLAPKSLGTLTAATKLRFLGNLRKRAMTNLNSVFKKQKHHFASKGPYSQSIKGKVIVIVISHNHSNKSKYWCIWKTVLERDLDFFCNTLTVPKFMKLIYISYVCVIIQSPKFLKVKDEWMTETIPFYFYLIVLAILLIY